MTSLSHHPRLYPIWSTAPPPPLASARCPLPLLLRVVSRLLHRRLLAAGSTALPTPTSIRNLWQEQEAAMDMSMASTGKPYDILPVHVEESINGYQEGLVSPDPDFARAVHPAASAPDMRQRLQDTPSFVHPPLPYATPAQTPGSPRPISVYSLHKSLPPLPGQEEQNQKRYLLSSSLPDRGTMYDMCRALR